MSYNFNAFNAPLTESSTQISFSAGFEQAGLEVRINGSSLAYDEMTGTMTGTIESIEIFDPAALGGAVLQTVAIDAGDQAGLAGLITTFLGRSLGIIADTFTAWDLAAEDFAALGEPIVTGGGTVVTAELRDSNDVLIGFVRLNGSGFDVAITSDGPASLGIITSVEHLDINGDPIVADTVDYSGDPRSLAELSYGFLTLGIPDLGDEEELYQIFAGGNNTITKNDVVDFVGFNGFDGGAGNDTFVSNSGGSVDYFHATAAVVINLEAGTATGGGGSDTWAAGSLGGAHGSVFDDTITGFDINQTGVESWLSGGKGNDTINGGTAHDNIDGGEGNDVINAGDGDDIIFGGLGDDEIHGGDNNGDLFGVPGEGVNDVLTYSSYFSLADGVTKFAADAELYVTGVNVTISGEGAGTVTGAGGTDTFDGIEEILGTKNADVFTGLAGVVSVFSGMNGADTFNGGGDDWVDYGFEWVESTIWPTFLAGTFNSGAIVNLSAGSLFSLAAGTALDSFGQTDTLSGIANIYGTFFNDIIVGSASSNTLIGWAGYDILVGGAGNDQFFTGNGLSDIGTVGDLIDYRFDGGANGITVTVADDGVATITDTHGDTDTAIGLMTIGGTDTDDIFNGSINTDRFAAGAGDDTITSGGPGGVIGGDQITYLIDDSATSGIAYDGTNGLITSTYFGTDTLIGFTSIWLEATQFTDNLVGGGGDDVFLASLSADIIDGGGGLGDALSYVDYRTTATGNGVTYNATSATSGSVLDAGGATDTYSNIEVLAGSMNSDTFNGSGGNDTFLGHGGNDNIIGGGGIDTAFYGFEDTLAIGLGINLFALNNANGIHGINANLDTGIVTGLFEDLNTVGLEDTDTLNGISNVIGSAYNDIIVGNADGNFLNGGFGFDLLLGGDGADILLPGGFGLDPSEFGFDILVGGAGTDLFDASATPDSPLVLVSYNEDGPAGVRINLSTITQTDGVTTYAAGTALDGAGDTDTLVQIVNVVGSAGDDQFWGGIEFETFTSGLGNDYADGGDGLDALFYGHVAVLGGDLTGRLAGISVNFVDAGGFATSGTVVGDVADGDTDTFDNIESVVGTSFADVFNGAASSHNRFVGMGGSDVFNGTTIVNPVGSDGFDTADYSFEFLAGATSGITIDLSAVPDIDGYVLVTDTLGNTDFLLHIENVTGTNFIDTMIGNEFDNTFDGGGDADAMSGLDGNDTYVFDNLGDSATEALNQGVDTIAARISGVTLSDNIEQLILIDTAFSGTGNELDNFMTGNNFDNELDGGDGNDTFEAFEGADTMIGGAGNDTYNIEDATDIADETGGSGNDLVNSQISFSLSDAVHAKGLIERLTLLGPALTGTGNAQVNTITGNGLANTLDGLGSADTLIGGAGNDIYMVDVLGDVTTEIVGGGTADRVRASATYVLGAAANIEFLETANAALTSAINLTGNALAQTITGNAGINTLDGGTDALVDTLTGGAGNDTYIVNTTDIITEIAGQGTADRARANQTFTLAADDNIEFLETSNAALATAINLTGNALAQMITGNAGINTLNGGTDALVDTLTGGAGNDIYVVNTTDIITEIAGQGTADRARANQTFTLAADDNVEFLETSNAALATAINLTGNALAQTITGNAGINTLDGGTDALVDTLIGGAGNDTYIVNTTDIITEIAGQGTADRARANQTFTLAADDNIEFLETSNAALATAINLTGNALAQMITGNAGINTLNGGTDALVDTLTGGAGNDIYVVNTTDIIVEGAGQGTADRARANQTFALAADDNIEFLETANAALATAINLTGNALAQTIIGNAGANVLNGGAGLDTLTGGLGGDFFVFNTALNAATNKDAITDFNVAADTFRLENTGAGLFNTLANGALNAAFFKANATGTATDADDRIIYNTASGALFYDSNGNVAGGATQFATLTSAVKPVLTALDFVVI